jgi:hypothetical protein
MTGTDARQGPRPLHITFRKLSCPMRIGHDSSAGGMCEVAERPGASSLWALVDISSSVRRHRVAQLPGGVRATRTPIVFGVPDSAVPVGRLEVDHLGAALSATEFSVRRGGGPRLHVGRLGHVAMAAPGAFVISCRRTAMGAGRLLGGAELELACNARRTSC